MCPKTGQVQTGRTRNSLLLSEEGAGSDRKNRKKPVCVRRRGRFRQEEREIACFCPKKRQVQTRRTGNSLFVSEEEAGSDRKNEKKPVCVRRRGRFRQEEREITCLCPKTGQVQTGRTGKSLFVSEDGAGSDRKNEK
ncbi:hypothetical protein M3598_11170 [Cytobacillus oceanisediminis]|uniref:hypothetical protein n=1 Tax=Cytobacillus TaxID=2675230 RepID=UPI00203B850E|nr:hypothetical protein [Cytobacillus oceanisediminis]MCM3243307.1 hypothetical protein [Cytobacillus oceanisediminis]